MSELIRLNFTYDKPTLNGRIYPKDILIPALDEAFNKQPLWIVMSTPEEKTTHEVDLSKIVGQAEYYIVRGEENIIYVACKITNQSYVGFHATSDMELTTMSMSELSKDNIITHCTITKLILIKKEENNGK